MSLISKIRILIPSFGFAGLGFAIIFANMYYRTIDPTADYNDRLLVGISFLLIGMFGIQITSFLTRNDIIVKSGEKK